MEIDLGTFSVRNFRDGDVASLARAANNPKIAANLRDRFPNPYTEQDAREYIEAVSGTSPPAQLAIARGDVVIGGIGLQRQQDVHRLSAEIGFFLDEREWGQGIATAAVRVVVAYGFEKLALVRIFGCVFETNEASSRVLQKCGFSFEGTHRKAVVKSDRLMDMHVYAILKP